jgi:mannose-1-phosphate guanylyltransferase / mannose-6-phosphate isomerase
MIQVTPVILCGGSGTRLWPLSRSGFPKQFLCLTGSASLFQQTVNRALRLGSDQIQTAPPLIVCNEEHRFLASEQLRETAVKQCTMLLEPVARNTAPAMTLAALAAMADGADPVLVVTPSDQAIVDEAAFASAMRAAVVEAAQGSIVILGITPDRPETGYGYIKTDPGTGAVGNLAPQDVERFVEKPDLKTAENYLKEGGFVWNAGIFVLRASVWLRALKQFQPDMLKAVEQAWQARATDALFVRPGQSDFEKVPSESVDYAVMEHCPGSLFPIKMIRLEAGWSDLGAWDAVWNVQPKDSAGNAHKGDVIAHDCADTFVHASNRLVTLVGLQNIAVIETADAVLVADLSKSQNVKHIVNALNQTKREEQTLHRKVYRPWGWYDSIDGGARFKVKRIMVKPKASLSLQMHHHRAEHWVVVTGTAQITNGDKTVILTENQSTYIPLGQTHRLINPGTIPLEIIEVQSGSYLGEDDIVRFEDNYGRSV